MHIPKIPEKLRPDHCSPAPAEVNTSNNPKLALPPTWLRNTKSNHTRRHGRVRRARVSRYCGMYPNISKKWHLHEVAFRVDCIDIMHTYTLQRKVHTICEQVLDKSSSRQGMAIRNLHRGCATTRPYLLSVRVTHTFIMRCFTHVSRDCIIWIHNEQIRSHNHCKLNVAPLWILWACRIHLQVYPKTCAVWRILPSDIAV